MDHKMWFTGREGVIDTALRVIGWMLLVDLASALFLLGLVAVAGRQGPTRVPLRVMLGVAFFLGIGTLLIYGGVWLMLGGRVARN